MDLAQLTSDLEALAADAAAALTSAQDVAAMVLFLVSPLGRNVSGQSLGVCGNVETL